MWVSFWCPLRNHPKGTCHLNRHKPPLRLRVGASERATPEGGTQQPPKHGLRVSSACSGGFWRRDSLKLQPLHPSEQRSHLPINSSHCGFVGYIGKGWNKKKYLEGHSLCELQLAANASRTCNEQTSIGEPKDHKDYCGLQFVFEHLVHADTPHTES